MAVVQVNETPREGKPATPKVDEMGPKLTDIFAKCSSQSGWAGDALAYLEQIRKQLEDTSRPITATMQYISDDAVAFTTDDNSSVVLVRESDIVNIPALVADAKLFNARNSFYNAFPSNKLLNIVSVNRFMYTRPSQMAAYITQTLMAHKDESIANFNIDMFGNRYQIKFDTEFSNVRQFFDIHSPNPTICGNFGFIASLVDKADSRFNTFQDSTPMFGVTGYVEFIRSEGTGTFTPMVHITEILSVLASPKMLALALPITAEIFVNRGLWRQPFSVIGQSDLNLGNLLVDQTTQKPYEVKTDVDFRKMFREFIGKPILCMDVKAGHCSIPGLNKLSRPVEHGQIIADIYSFLNLPTTTIDRGIGENIFKEIIGVIETSKTSKFSNLMDTRDVTYLFAVSKLKYSPKLEYLLGRSESDPSKRFDMIRDIVGEVVPTHCSITTLLYGDFLQQIATAVAPKINVEMPFSAELPLIDVNAFADKAYQPGVPVFGATGPQSLIGGGYIR